MKTCKWSIGLVALLGSAFSHADVLVNISAIIIKPACEVTGDGQNGELEVRFGELPLASVNTADAQKDIALKFSCVDGIPSNGKLRMYLRPSSFGALGSNILGTSMEGLGIEMLVASQKANFSQWVPVTVTTAGEMMLTAKLVAADLPSLSGGEFTASANMMMTYP
ncbi:MAG: fimbrial protein [Enterobacterales bacterium]|uniref:fimbrial protein n=1 Tax=Serratia sp. (in: enterobacteria) TaxID=616 RepID=UPI003F3818D5